VTRQELKQSKEALKELARALHKLYRDAKELYESFEDVVEPMEALDAFREEVGETLCIALEGLGDSIEEMRR